MIGKLGYLEVIFISMIGCFMEHDHQPGGALPVNSSQVLQQPLELAAVVAVGHLQCNAGTWDVVGQLEE